MSSALACVLKANKCYAERAFSLTFQNELEFFSAGHFWKGELTSIAAFSALKIARFQYPFATIVTKGPVAFMIKHLSRI